MKFIEQYPIEKLKPADYNPRVISDHGFEKLCFSIRKYGYIKPVILNGVNDTLTAGHQRIKAGKAVGKTTVPVISMCDISLQDEIRFNLFHNSIETNKSRVFIDRIGDCPFGYSFVSASAINIVNKLNPVVYTEIAHLIAKYGSWGSVVVDGTGLVIENAEYAVASKLYGKELLIFKLGQENTNEIKSIFSQDYGEYNYNSLNIRPYNQHYCQLPRLAGENNDSKQSSLYEKLILPSINKSERYFDFGAGKCRYPKKLNSEGFNFTYYEPYYHMEGSRRQINLTEVSRMIEDTRMQVLQHGLFDNVILDSVINSVTSLEYEDYVLTTCNAMLKMGGIFYTATRPLERIEMQMKADSKIESKKRRSLAFLDRNNFEAVFREGVWTMQHYHSRESWEALLKKYFRRVEIKFFNNLNTICSEPIDLPLERYEKALNAEYNIEYPGGFRHNRHTALVKLILEKLEKRKVQ